MTLGFVEEATTNVIEGDFSDGSAVHLHNECVETRGKRAQKNDGHVFVWYRCTDNIESIGDRTKGVDVFLHSHIIPKLQVE